MALERERESRNLGKIEEGEGLYSKNRPLFICTTKLTQGKSVNDNASNILKMQNNRKINSMKNILNAVSGITLIALVVTIVVLLILASVSITAVFGDNGILQLAKEAGDKTNEAVKNDISSIGELEDILHETQTGIKVDKVTDTKPGELEVDEAEEKTYIINSIEDLVAFAHNVTSGTENYAGKTVKLGLSLDFASTKSYVDANRTDYGKYGYDGELKKLLNESGFIPIGFFGRQTTEEENKKKNFQGTFDGNKNKIYNLKIKQSIERENDVYNIGIFSENYGTIKNLEIQNAQIDVIDVKSKTWGNIGILAGVNKLVIENCGVTGSINGTLESKKSIGGLSGVNGNKISNCYSKCNIYITGQDKFRVGGFVGVNQGERWYYCDDKKYL